MSELTKQYFDQQLGRQTKDIKTYVDDKVSYAVKKLETNIEKLDTKVEKLDTKVEKLGTKVEELDTKIETEVANLARITADGFRDIKKELDVRKEVDQLKVQMSKVWSALNIRH